MRKIHRLMSASTLALCTMAAALAQPQIPMAGETVKGAPYSAEAIAETTQILADGSRVTTKTSTRIYRDSQGRERREQALDPATGFSATPNRAPTVQIFDPVAQANYTLNVLGHSAVRIPMLSTPPPAFGNSGAGNPAGGFAPSITFQPTPGSGGAGASQWVIVQGQHTESAAPPPPSPTSATRIERLEPRMIEGVMAEGTRMIEAIPARRAGNAQPIEMITETWISPELKVEVLKRHNDPRTGETVYRLTNILQNEPSRALFQVPGDYSISEMPAISGGMITGGVSAGSAAPRN